MPTTLHAIPSLAQQSFMHRLWFQDQAATELARSTDNLYLFIVWTCVISFTITIGLAYYFAWKYRRRPGVPIQRSPSHNTPLELAWSIIPLIIMVIIFFWGFRDYIEKQAAPGNAEIIRVTGQQWSWSAVYDNGREVLPDEFEVVGGKASPIIVVPEGRPVKLLLTSKDVIHSFFIPDMRMKIDVFPNRYTSFWFEALEAGKDHKVFCAEYCGQDHSEMNAVIRVVTEDEYRAHKSKELQIEDPVEFGRYLWQRGRGCAACHSIDGSASTGPTWKGLFGRETRFTNGQTYTAEQMSDVEFFSNYVRESVFDPKARIVAGYPDQMNSYVGLLNEEQLSAIIAFMMSPEVSGRAAPASPTPAGAAEPATGGEPSETPAEAPAEGAE